MQALRSPRTCVLKGVLLAGFLLSLHPQVAIPCSPAFKCDNLLDFVINRPEAPEEALKAAVDAQLERVSGHPGSSIWLADCLLSYPDTFHPLSMEATLLKLNDSPDTRQRLDIIELHSLPAGQQAAILEAAAIRGSVTLWRGTALTRPEALHLVAEWGLAGLDNLVYEYCEPGAGVPNGCMYLTALRTFFPEPGYDAARRSKVIQVVTSVHPCDLETSLQASDAYFQAMLHAVEFACPYELRGTEGCTRLYDYLVDANLKAYGTDYWWSTRALTISKVAQSVAPPCYMPLEFIIEYPNKAPEPIAVPP